MLSPLIANTGTPEAAIAAAAWSCVEKILHVAQRTLAPSAVSVSISTAVWIVMCSEPTMRAPFNGCDAPNSSRKAIRPEIGRAHVELQSLMRISYAVFCLKKKTHEVNHTQEQ